MAHNQDDDKAGYCSATCVDVDSMKREIKKKEVNTSDVYHVCNLPKRFEHPHWFNGYGSQTNKQHPFYRTTSNDYGWYPPGIHSVTNMYLPRNQRFTNTVAPFGMYRNYSLNTGTDESIHSIPSAFFPSGQTFTNKLAQAGMYRNYSLNTGMDPAPPK